MAVSIPTHSQWKTFKATYGIPKNAVRSVNVGKELDTYHSKLGRNFKTNATNAARLEKKLAE